MQNRKPAPEGLYSAAEAMEIIGVKPTSFYNLVNRGEIIRVLLPGRKEGYYSKSAIDTYARIRNAIQAPYSTELMDFVPAFTEDLPTIHNLVASVAGGTCHAVPVDVLKGWIRKNPQSVHILRYKTEILGYTAMFPLMPDTLTKRLNGQLLNREIPFDDILPFESGKSIHLYIAELAVKHRPEYLINNEPTTDPEKTKEMDQERKLGARLIKEIARFIAERMEENITITGLYAVGTSQFGIALCERIGMSVMDLPTGVRPDRKPFSTLNVPDARLIRRFLAEKR